MNFFKCFFVLLSLFISSLGYSQVTPKNGLVGYWSFDGHAKDSTKFSNNATVYGATLTTGRDGKSNTAYRFDGVNDYITIPGASELKPNSLTVNLWVKYSKDKTNFAIFTSGTSAGGEYGMDIEINSSVKVFSQIGGGSNDRFLAHHTLRNLSDNEWHMLTFTYDSAENTITKFYIDGCYYGENNIDVGTRNFQSSDRLTYTSYDWHVGARAASIVSSSGPARYFQGDIDEITIHNRALSKLEIKKMFSPDIVTYDTIQVYDTTYKTINDTSFFNLYDTTHVSINDTTFYSVYDTTTIFINDTTFTTIYDTSFIVLNDTTFTTVYDTTYRTIYDTNYISVTDTLYLDLKRTSGVNTYSCQMKIYPNPTDGILIIEGGSDCNSSGYTIRVLSATGKLVYSSSIIHGSKTFSLDEFVSSGLHFVEISDGRGKLVNRKKIIVL